MNESTIIKLTVRILNVLIDDLAFIRFSGVFPDFCNILYRAEILQW